MQHLEDGLRMYYFEWKTYPYMLAPLGTGYVYDNNGFIDPFGNSYYYKRLDKGVGYELFSIGADGAPRTLDDVIPGQRPQFCTRSRSITVAEYKEHGPGFFPCAIARAELHTLQAELRAFRIDTGQYPDSLLELNSMMTDGVYWGAPSMYIDPWGAPYLYARLASRYELYSNGQDGISGTVDDVVSPSVRCEDRPFSIDRWDPTLNPRIRAFRLSATSCGTVSQNLSALACQIETYRSKTGKLPRVLSDLLNTDNMSEVRLYTDPWGQPYFYKRLPSRFRPIQRLRAVDSRGDDCPQPQPPQGYVLFSNGPDQLPNTDDDLPYGFDPEKCWRPPHEAISFQEVYEVMQSLDASAEDLSPAEPAFQEIGSTTEADPNPPLDSPHGGCSFRAY